MKLYLNGKLGTGKYIIIDSDDFLRLSKQSWTLRKTGYVTSYDPENRNKTLLVHRVIMKTPKGMETDHINGDKLDNRKANLRICTRTQNTHNISKRSDAETSTYRGVRRAKRNLKKPWQALITSDGKTYIIGYFEKEIEASEAWNKKAKELYGEFARLNT